MGTMASHRHGGPVYMAGSLDDVTHDIGVAAAIVAGYSLKTVVYYRIEH